MIPFCHEEMEVAVRSGRVVRHAILELVSFLKRGPPEGLASRSAEALIRDETVRQPLPRYRR